MIKGSQGTQLKMFDTASNIMTDLLTGKMGSHETELYTDGTDDSPEEESRANLSMMRDKMREADVPYDIGSHGSGVTDSIAKHGFRGHIVVDQSGDREMGSLWEGHHRLAGATKLEMKAHAEGKGAKGTQWVGIDHIDARADHSNDVNQNDSYQRRFPQNLSDRQWSSGRTLDT